MRRYNAQAHRFQGAYYYGDLWSYLYSGLPEGSVRFGQEVGLGGEREGKGSLRVFVRVSEEMRWRAGGEAAGAC